MIYEGQKTVDWIKAQLRCGNPGCKCQQHNGNVHCVTHDDPGPSLSINDGGYAPLYHCFGSCSQKVIIEEMKRRNLHPGKEAVHEVVKDHLSQTSYTVKDYAQEKVLSENALRTDYSVNDDGKTVSIPYYYENGTFFGARLRKANHTFRWQKDDDKPLILYGLWKIKDMEDYVFLVEGESDTHTLWQNGINALGVPGVKTWRPEFEKLFDKFKDVYVVIEPDEGGKVVLNWLDSSEESFKKKVKLITSDCLNGFKDVSDMWLNKPDKETFLPLLRESIKDSSSLLEYTTAVPELPKTSIIETEGMPGVGVFKIVWTELNILAEVSNFVETRDKEIKVMIKLSCSRITYSGPLATETMTLTSSLRKGQVAKRCYESDPSLELNDWKYIMDTLCNTVLSSYTQEEEAVLLTGDENIEDETEYIAYPYIERGTATSIYGYGGSGKSWFALLLALLIANGKDFDIIKVQKGNALYVDYEASKKQIQKRRNELCKALGIPLNATKDNGVYYQWLKRNIKESIDIIREQVVKHNIDFIVVDSVGAGLGGDHNDAMPVQQLYDSLRSIKQDITFLLVDHSNKDGVRIGSVMKTNLSRNEYQVQALDWSEDDLSFSVKHTKYNNTAQQKLTAWQGTFENNKLITFGPMTQEEIVLTDAREQMSYWDRVRLYLLQVNKATSSEIADHLNMNTKDLQPKLSKWKSFKIPRVHNDDKGYWYLTAHDFDSYSSEPDPVINIPFEEEQSEPVEPSPPAPLTTAPTGDFTVDDTSDLSPERQRAIAEWEAKQRAIYGDNWRDREQSI